MNHRTLLLTALASLVGVSGSAQFVRIVVQGTGAPQVFSDLAAAVAAAQPDDHLYLSGGTFTVSGNIVVDKPLHFVGAGIHPDSSSVTTITTINTSGATQVHTAGSGSSFTGIRFSNTMQYGDGTANFSPTGIVFQRCEFNSYAHLGAGSETVIDECIFRFRFYGYDGTALVTRSIFTYWGNATHAPISAFGTGGLTMDHCTVIGGRITNSANSTVSNCIFTRNSSAPFWQSSGSTITNNLCVFTSLTSNMTPGATNGNVLGLNAADSLFVNEISGNYEFSDDLHLVAVSPGVGMATDGTDVGVYGTTTPYKPGAVPFNPHLRSAVVDPTTNMNGELPVNIRVAAQTH
ncbi:MAG: hypothetical protein IPM49_08470 [Flavobacteriales bacterium]|nr:hypothetical protein [Flavobacteriales bacterium]